MAQVYGDILYNTDSYWLPAEEFLETAPIVNTTISGDVFSEALIVGQGVSTSAISGDVFSTMGLNTTAVATPSAIGSIWLNIAKTIAVSSESIVSFTKSLRKLIIINSTVNTLLSSIFIKFIKSARAILDKEVSYKVILDAVYQQRPGQTNTASATNLAIDQGSEFYRTMTLVDTSRTIVDLTNYTIAGQLRKSYTTTESISLNIVIINAVLGKFSMSLSNLITDTLTSPRYVYDVEITSSGMRTYRILEGNIIVSPNVTR